jgi:tetratricopeptide (TPR) repeat protein
MNCIPAANAYASPQFKDERGFEKKLTPAEIEYQSAQQYMNMESYYSAAEHLEKAVKLDPEYLEAWTMLGTAYMNVKKYKEAVDAFLKAHELEPSNKSLISSLGYNYLSLNDLDNAEKYYGILTEQDSLDYNGNIHLGFIAKSRGNVDAALDFYRKALKSKPSDSVTLGTIASLYLEKGDKKKEVEYLQKAYEADPSNYTMMQKLASAYFNMPDYEKAVEIYKKLVEVYPDQSAFHQRLGFSISQAGGDYKEATAELEKANFLSGGDPFTYALLAKIYNDNKEYDKAIKASKDGLNLGQGQEAFLRYQLGEALSKKTQYEDAMAQFQKVVNLKTEPWSSSALKQVDRQEKLIKRREAEKERAKYE